MATSMLGIDIGSAQLKIAYWDGSSVKKMVAADMPDNMVKNDTIVSYDAMADFIKDTLKKAHIMEKKVAFILPSQSAFLRRVTVPYMSNDQLKVNLPYEFRDFLNDTKDKYLYDYLVTETINDEEGKPKELDILASAIFRDTLNSFKEMFKRAGLHLEIAVPREAAYINLIRSCDGAQKKEYAFLDLGHMSTRIDIYTGTSFETTRSIDLGLKDVDIAIADAEKVDEHVARSYKTQNYKNCLDMPYARKLYDVISSDLRKTINFYGFSNRESNLKDIYLCGGGVNILPLLRSVHETLNDMDLHLISDILPPISDKQTNPAAFAAAIGAVLQNTKGNAENINLVMKEKAKIQSKVLLPAIIIILLAAAAFAKFLVLDRMDQLAELQSQADMLRSEYDSLDAYLADYDEIAAKNSKYSVGWMSESEKTLLERNKILAVMDQEILPKCTVTGFTISGNTVSAEVTGCTLEQLSKLVEKMQKREEVKDVMVRSAVTDDATGDLSHASLVFTLNDPEVE